MREWFPPLICSACPRMEQQKPRLGVGRQLCWGLLVLHSDRLAMGDMSVVTMVSPLAV